MTKNLEESSARTASQNVNSVPRTVTKPIYQGSNSFCYSTSTHCAFLVSQVCHTTWLMEAKLKAVVIAVPKYILQSTSSIPRITQSPNHQCLIQGHEDTHRRSSTRQHGVDHPASGTSSRVAKMVTHHKNSLQISLEKNGTFGWSSINGHRVDVAPIG